MTRKIYFVSTAQPGHSDFGGGSFTKLAVNLQQRGHQVHWYLTECSASEKHARIKALLKQAGVTSVCDTSLPNAISNDPTLRAKQAERFNQWLEQRAPDCLVMDRICTAAAEACTRLSLPWAAVGTDGRPRIHTRIGPQPHPNSGSPSADSPAPPWAISPYLNLCFFPRAFYEVPQPRCPASTHFLGTGEREPERSSKSNILLSLGNSFYPRLIVPMAKILYAQALHQGTALHILSGSARQSRELRQVLPRSALLQIDDWMPYDQAFREARIVAGHGGSAVTWQGLRQGTPLLVCPHVGDQCANAKQIERLNIGRIIGGNMSGLFLPRRMGRGYRALASRLDIRASRMRQVCSELEHPDVQKACRQMAVALSRGGGINAGSRLIEALAESGKPQTRCLDTPCCC